MKRPDGVTEISTALAINAIAMTFGGLLFLFWYITSPSNAKGGFLVASSCLLVMGVPLGLLTIGFYTLQRWSYPIVKQMIAGPFRLKGMGGLTEKIKSPEVRRVFGVSILDHEIKERRQGK